MTRQLKRISMVMLIGLITLPATAGTFDRTLTEGKFSFQVQSTNNSSINQLTLLAMGLDFNREPIVQDVDGIIYNAETADLDTNGFPEVYVYIASAGSGSYGSLAAWAVNKGKSLSPIYLPPLQDNPAYTLGYMGHDTFSVSGATLVRRFPLYRPGDINANPTAGRRELHYKLVAGEAGWVLQVEKVIDL